MTKRKERCLVCNKVYPNNKTSTSQTDLWIQCDQCNGWIHESCSELTDSQVVKIEAYKCIKCINENQKGMKRKSSRTSGKVDYRMLNDGNSTLYTDIIQKLEDASHKYHIVEIKNGNGLTNDTIWDLIQQEDYFNPILVQDPEGLDMNIDRKNISIKNIKTLVGKYYSLL
ncbi:hypothetical protein BB559_003537 [Furculomyces boomerangus]|uniref:PHD-type domain-containing protein n=1 Tax=Furculomyces boomerangus TaxID=61424 RepID=A0A2T9YKN7_9FUNG|nr:hypothetical protein BB559_007036 [Furculomyces boomerangus]PVU85675.1 hypothetical protein BB559_006868 [Furculomyces boomerangus]PVU92906.1 hypothetical protein BB559_003537 [Furculomyces boomerangus]